MSLVTTTVQASQRKNNQMASLLHPLRRLTLTCPKIIKKFIMFIRNYFPIAKLIWPWKAELNCARFDLMRIFLRLASQLFERKANRYFSIKLISIHDENGLPNYEAPMVPSQESKPIVFNWILAQQLLAYYSDTDVFIASIELHHRVSIFASSNAFVTFLFSRKINICVII